MRGSSEVVCQGRAASTVAKPELVSVKTQACVFPVVLTPKLARLGFFSLQYTPVGLVTSSVQNFELGYTGAAKFPS